MSNVTELAGASINGHESITVELIEADETPGCRDHHVAAKPSVIHPRRFADTAATLAKLFAEAATTLAGLKARRRR